MTDRNIFPSPDAAESALRWLSLLDEDDRALCLAELAEAARIVESGGDPEELAALLDAWRVTAETLTDARRRAVLYGDPQASDFVEAPRPGAD